MFGMKTTIFLDIKIYFKSFEQNIWKIIQNISSDKSIPVSMRPDHKSNQRDEQETSETHSDKKITKSLWQQLILLSHPEAELQRFEEQKHWMLSPFSRHPAPCSGSSSSSSLSSSSSSLSSS